MARAVTALLFAVLSGCVQLPPQVAAELTPPDGVRPNNYQLHSAGAKAKPAETLACGKAQC
jgi:hypothetical protein